MGLLQSGLFTSEYCIMQSLVSLLNASCDLFYSASVNIPDRDLNEIISFQQDGAYEERLVSNLLFTEGVQLDQSHLPTITGSFDKFLDEIDRTESNDIIEAPSAEPAIRQHKKENSMNWKVFHYLGKHKDFTVFL